MTAQDGSTSIWSESVISSAVTHEIRRLLLLRWLRLADAPPKEGETKQPGLGIMEKASLLDRIGTATNERDKCLKLLGLDQKPSDSDPWAFLHAPTNVKPAPLPAPATQTPSHDPEATQATSEATAGHHGDTTNNDVSNQ